MKPYNGYEARKKSVKENLPAGGYVVKVLDAAERLSLIHISSFGISRRVLLRPFGILTDAAGLYSISPSKVALAQIRLMTSSWVRTVFWAYPFLAVLSR